MTKRKSRNKRKRDQLVATSDEAERIDEEEVTSDAKRMKMSDDIAKFYAMRYRLWHRYDEGIQMDETGLYSVTPEKIAVHTAQRLCETKVIVIDAFAGVGGNSIQFALQPNCLKVFAIELDQQRIQHAENNARVYEAEEKITFICADFMQMIHILPSRIEALIRDLDEDEDVNVVVFLAPPYGGTHATLTEEYDMDEMKPVDAMTLVKLCRTYLSDHICFLLPKNITFKQIADIVSASQTDAAEYEENMLSGRCKTVSLYLSDLLVKPDVCESVVELVQLYSQ